MSDDRTEPASPKRRKKAREDGQVARSAELVGSAALLLVLWAIPSLAPQASDQMTGYFVRTVATAGSGQLDDRTLLDLTGKALSQVGTLAAPVLGLVIASAVVSNLAQVGFFLNSKSLAPKWSMLDPLKGLKRLFAPTSFFNLAKGMVKLAVVGWVGWQFLAGRWEQLFELHGVPPAQAAPILAGMAHGMALQMAAALLLVAALDYVYQRWQMERQLKMTKQEVKDEIKESEGNPEIKGRLRQRQRELSRRRMMADVPTATLVLANPTHFSVALKYEAGQKGAPRVVAKGQDLIALRIRESAREHGVPVVENPPLARALYQACEVGQEIPASLFRALAEVLALVWRLDRAASGR